MSDAVALALIGMFKSWGELFVQHLPVIVPAVGSAVVGYMTWRNNIKSEARTQAMKADFDRVQAAAVRSKEEADLQAKGAERNAWAEATVKIRAESMPAALHPEFKPESTDVFMSKGKGRP